MCSAFFTSHYPEERLLPFNLFMDFLVPSQPSTRKYHLLQEAFPDPLSGFLQVLLLLMLPEYRAVVSSEPGLMAQCTTSTDDLGFPLRHTAST